MLKLIFVPIFLLSLAQHALAKPICINDINVARNKAQLAPIEYDKQIKTAASSHTMTMIKDNCFKPNCTGETPLGDLVTEAGFKWKTVSILIAAGPISCSEAVDIWARSSSPKHDDKGILFGNFTHGACSGRECKGKGKCDHSIYYTCIFATPIPRFELDEDDEAQAAADTE